MPAGDFVIPPANGPDAFVDFHMVQVPVHFHRRMEVLMAVAITRTDLTSRELRAAGSRSHDARAARRMVAVALVPEGADRKSAAFKPRDGLPAATGLAPSLQRGRS